MADYCKGVGEWKAKLTIHTDDKIGLADIKAIQDSFKNGNLKGVQNNIKWEAHVKVNIEGQKLNWNELSDSNINMIAEKLFNGQSHGSIEDEIRAFPCVFDYDLGNGYKLDMQTIEDMVMDERTYQIYNKEGTLLYDGVYEDGKDLDIMTICEIIKEEFELYPEEYNCTSLDDKIAAAEEKSANSNEDKETKAHDDLEL